MNTRRYFIKTAGLAGSIMTVSPSVAANYFQKTQLKRITIAETNSNIEREDLLRPFGFKGGYHSEKWQSANSVISSSGIKKVGLTSQGINWSDSWVFSNYSIAGGNALMYVITEQALKMLKGMTFTSPIEVLEDIFDDVYQYGIKVTANPNLKKTFALNALVGVDNALWMLYAAENGMKNFDEMIPEIYKPALTHHHKYVACIPLINYSVPVEEIKQTVEEGYYFMKIKIGQPGTQEEMLEKDKQRLTQIHKTIGQYRTEHTKDGKLPYYFDANGRYEKKETLLRLIDHAKKIGAYDQIAIIEEPFPEEADIDVSDISLRLAADESAHTVEDAVKRIQMGYRAIALKAIAKTMSMTMKIANAAKKNGVPCFCADLTVSPILIDWNKNIAARLDPFPGLGTGLLETNGHQNYKDWAKQESYHPYKDASWRKTQNGVFVLNDDFYKKSGGILTDSEYYMSFV
jgi:L-alanine-DL-glutamate epimerase-like enolase superfamily enzyme